MLSASTVHPGHKPIDQSWQHYRDVQRHVDRMAARVLRGCSMGAGHVLATQRGVCVWPLAAAAIFRPLTWVGRAEERLRDNRVHCRHCNIIFEFDPERFGDAQLRRLRAIETEIRDAATGGALETIMICPRWPSRASPARMSGRQGGCSRHRSGKDWCRTAAWQSRPIHLGDAPSLGVAYVADEGVDATEFGDGSGKSAAANLWTRDIRRHAQMLATERFVQPPPCGHKRRAASTASPRGDSKLSAVFPCRCRALLL